MTREYYMRDDPSFQKALAECISADYAIIKPISEGDNGATFLVEHLATKRQYCLKTISPAANLSREKEKAKRLLENETMSRRQYDELHR